MTKDKKSKRVDLEIVGTKGACCEICRGKTLSVLETTEVVQYFFLIHGTCDPINSLALINKKEYSKSGVNYYNDYGILKEGNSDRYGPFLHQTNGNEKALNPAPRHEIKTEVKCEVKEEEEAAKEKLKEDSIVEISYRSQWEGKIRKLNEYLVPFSFKEIKLQETVTWSGNNNINDRVEAAEKLKKEIDDLFTNNKEKEVWIHLIGHSHGGNVIQSLLKKYAEEKKGDYWNDQKEWKNKKIKSIIYLSTPFFGDINSSLKKNMLTEKEAKQFIQKPIQYLCVYNTMDATAQLIASFNVKQNPFNLSLELETKLKEQKIGTSIKVVTKALSKLNSTYKDIVALKKIQANSSFMQSNSDNNLFYYSDRLYNTYQEKLQEEQGRLLKGFDFFYAELIHLIEKIKAIDSVNGVSKLFIDTNKTLGDWLIEQQLLLKKWVTIERPKIIHANSENIEQLIQKLLSPLDRLINELLKYFYNEKGLKFSPVIQALSRHFSKQKDFYEALDVPIIVPKGTFGKGYYTDITKFDLYGCSAYEKFQIKAKRLIEQIKSKPDDVDKIDATAELLVFFIANLNSIKYIRFFGNAITSYLASKLIDIGIAFINPLVRKCINENTLMKVIFLLKEISQYRVGLDEGLEYHALISHSVSRMYIFPEIEEFLNDVSGLKEFYKLNDAEMKWEIDGVCNGYKMVWKLPKNFKTIPKMWPTSTIVNGRK